jgi:hypothetical protein
MLSDEDCEEDEEALDVGELEFRGEVFVFAVFWLLITGVSFGLIFKADGHFAFEPSLVR